MNPEPKPFSHVVISGDEGLGKSWFTVHMLVR